MKKKTKKKRSQCILLKETKLNVEFSHLIYVHTEITFIYSAEELHIRTFQYRRGLFFYHLAYRHTTALTFRFIGFVSFRLATCFFFLLSNACAFYFQFILRHNFYCESKIKCNTNDVHKRKWSVYCDENSKQFPIEHSNAFLSFFHVKTIYDKALPPRPLPYIRLFFNWKLPISSEKQNYNA